MKTVCTFGEQSMRQVALTGEGWYHPTTIDGTTD